jgi:hypothetical protein
LASGIDIKDDDATSLSVEDAANSFRCLPFSETMLKRMQNASKYGQFIAARK